MWTRQELKTAGKAAFKANYWKNVLVAFILNLLIGGTATASINTGTSQGTNNADPGQTAPEINIDSTGLSGEQMGFIIAAVVAVILVIIAVAVLMDIFLYNPLKIGCYGFFRDNVGSGKADVNTLATGFRDYKRSFVIMLLRGLYVFLWSLLFIVPGIVKSYSYRMVPFIIRDDPELSSREVIEKSRTMMDGHKWDTFVLDLSFIGWSLLSGITLGLAGIFWVNPYYQNTNAALYLKLRGDELPEVYQSEETPVIEVETEEMEERDV